MTLISEKVEKSEKSKKVINLFPDNRKIRHHGQRILNSWDRYLKIWLKFMISVYIQFEELK